MTQELQKTSKDAAPNQADESTAVSIGPSGHIAQAFINAPVTPILLIGCLCIGLLGLFLTPRQEDPQISVPMIDIFVQYPGTSAKQVESLVAQPLERIMKEIPGVQHVYSAIMRGSAVVTVRFYVGEDMGASIVKVHDKLQSNLNKIPPDVQMPLVKPVSVDDVPIVAATLWSKEVDDAQLRTIALAVLQELGSVKDTGKGFVVGGRHDQIRVEVLMERLAGYGITLDRIAGTIKSANSEIPTGGTESDGKAYSVYSGAFLRNADDVARLVVGTQGGHPIYVADVATVSQIPEDPSQIVTHYTGPAHLGDLRADGEQAVTLAIAKKAKTNGVDVANAVLAKLEKLESNGGIIPKNVHVEITRNYGKTANDKVNELLQAMFEAVAIVSILCLVGLGLRASIVVILVIPVVILLTIWWAMAIGYTIDRVSLFALIFSIGILVDDAIVVVENIFRHWLERGHTSISQAVWAVDEVGNPTILATLTIISALLPMGWVSGLMGPYMRPIPVLGAAAIAFSLFAAFVFTPWFALLLRPSNMDSLRKAEEREAVTHRIVAKLYRPLVMPLVENRSLGLIFLFSIIAAVFWACSLFYTQTVAVKMLPFDNKPEFSVIVNMPEGTALPETANVVRQLAEKTRAIPEVTAIQTYAGTAQPFNFNGMVRHYYLRQNPWEGDFLVMLKDKKERKLSSHELAVQTRHLLTPIAHNLGAKIAVVEMPPGPPVLQTVVAEVYGPTDEVRRQFAADMTSMFEKAGDVVDVDNYMISPYDYWRFEVDTEKAVRRGISVDSINQNLAMAMGGFKVGDVKRGNVLEPTYIVLQVPLANRSELNSLGSLPIMSPSGEIVPLGELGRFVPQHEDPIIYHIDLHPMEYVVGEMEGFLGAPIYGMFGVENLLTNYTAPDQNSDGTLKGVKVTGMPAGLLGPPADTSVSSFEWSGEWTVTYETFRDMGMAFMAALLLIYGLIVWQFGDLALAGLIMAPIPLTLIGIIPGHWIMHAEFTATSMIGLIALSGIIVRQSILIVQFVKIEVAKGMSVREAAVTGAEIRMRPIIITSLAVVGGAWTLMFDPIFQGMAVATFFGVLVGTLLAVIVIPLGCISLRKHFYFEETASGEIALSQRYYEIEIAGGGRSSVQAHAPITSAPAFASRSRTPIWFSIWSTLITIIFTVISIVVTIWRWIGFILSLFVPPKPRPRPTTGPVNPPPANSVPNPPTPDADNNSNGTPPANESGSPGSTTPPAIPIAEQDQGSIEAQAGSVESPDINTLKRKNRSASTAISSAEIAQKSLMNESSLIESKSTDASKPLPTARSKIDTAGENIGDEGLNSDLLPKPEEDLVSAAARRKTVKGFRGIRLRNI